jgi:hypothetical protein
MCCQLHIEPERRQPPLPYLLDTEAELLVMMVNSGLKHLNTPEVERAERVGGSSPEAVENILSLWRAARDGLGDLLGAMQVAIADLEARSSRRPQ